MKREVIQTRNAPQADPSLQTREVPLMQRGLPSSLDEESRSVEVVAATEQPVRILDWERGPVDEVLLVSGADCPASARLLNTHNRWSVDDILGSLTDFRVEGDKLLARATISKTAEGAWTRLREGHLDSVSVGYVVRAYVWIEDGQTATVEGREFAGPLKVVTDWAVREVSLVPIPADSQAKVRSANQETKPKERTMPEWLKNLATRQGLDLAGMTEAQVREKLGLGPEITTEAEARAALDAASDENHSECGNEPAQARAAAPQPTPAPDARQIALEAVAAERARVSGIDEMCRTYGVSDELRQRLLDEGRSLEQARDAVLEALRPSPDQPAGVGHRGPAVVTADARDKFRSAGEHSLLLRAGQAVEQAAPGSDELRGYSMVELAREALRQAGERTGGTVVDMVGRALSVSDLPVILGNVANLSLMQGYDLAEETWRQWADGSGSVSNFNIHTAARATELDDLDEITDHDGEYKYGTIEEESEQYQIATYGKLFAITRKAIINDDMSALIDIPQKHGRAAARKIGDVVCAVLIANAAMGDEVALFHADHNNLLTGADPGSAAFDEAMVAMGTQTDKNNARLNIKPKYFIAPLGQWGTAEDFFGTTQIAQTDGSLMSNRYATGIERVYEPRLDDDSTSAWYMAGPKGMTVKVFFLNGVQKPYTETRQGWSRDGVEYKVRIDAGAKAMDWRALLKNPGA